MKYTIGLVFLLSFTSCSFNRQFYQPDKIRPDAKMITIADKESGDTVLLHLEGAEHRAYFTDSRNKPKSFGYSMETISFASTDGNTLYGWFLKPDNNPNPKITLLFLHGNGANVFSHLTLAAPLVKQGFQVFLIDYSGYGFSTGSPTRKNMVADASAALKLLRSRADVQNTKLMIYGQSIGAHLSAEVARINEKNIDGLVMEGAPSSHKDIAAHMIRPFGFVARVLVHEGYAAKRSIRHFHKPLLVIHSTEDKVAPFSMGQKIFRHANDPKTFYAIQHDHIYGPRYYADSIAYKIRAMVGE
jgi:uncharacterized protein